MKKVLALVLAVIMVCTMAMAVTVTTTTTPSGTSSGPYEIATPGSSLKVTLTEAIFYNLAIVRYLIVAVLCFVFIIKRKALIHLIKQMKNVQNKGKGGE